MKPLLALLLAVVIAGCVKPDPYAKYRDAQLKRGMTIADIKMLLGEPDNYEDSNSKYANGQPCFIEILKYGAFGTQSHQYFVTYHRLEMTFHNSALYEWRKSTPVR